MSRDLCASLEKIGRKQPQPISLPRRYRGHRWPLPLSETGASPWLASSVRVQLKSLRRDRSPRTPWSRSSPARSGSFRVSLRNTSSAGWENPLMGWTSTGDPYANVGDAGLAFDSEEAAKAFAEKHGWDYLVKKRHTPLMKVRAYADNFKWKAPPKAEAA